MTAIAPWSDPAHIELEAPEGPGPGSAGWSLPAHVNTVDGPSPHEDPTTLWSLPAHIDTIVEPPPYVDPTSLWSRPATVDTTAVEFDVEVFAYDGALQEVVPWRAIIDGKHYEVEPYGFYLHGKFRRFSETTELPPAEPEPEAIRAELPWMHPYHHESFWNTPVGSGAMYVPKSDVRHTSTFAGSDFNINYNNWTDPFYVSSLDDPIVEIMHRTDLPAGWSSVTNSQTMARNDGSTQLRQRYEGVRVPPSATWQSTSNTDRKVIIIQGQETTLRRFNSLDQLVDEVTYPAGTLSVEIHKFQRITGGELIMCTNLSFSDLRGYGMGYGALASGVGMSQGYVRRWEIDRILETGDYTVIRHALKIGLPGQKLKVGQVWPASHQDGNTEGYTGHNPMGSFFVLDRNVNIDTLGYLGSTAARRLQKAFAWTLQNFGGYALIRSGNGPLNLGIEPTPPALSGGLVTELRDGLRTAVFPHMRIVSNGHDVGPLNADRTPVDPSRIAGGGTHLEAIRPLPLSEEGPWFS